MGLDWERQDGTSVKPICRSCCVESSFHGGLKECRGESCSHRGGDRQGCSEDGFSGDFGRRYEGQGKGDS